MRRPPIEFLIAHAYARHFPWLTKVKRVPANGLWCAWPVGERLAANDETFNDAQAVEPHDTLTH